MNKNIVIPKYFQERPELLSLGEILVERVYDNIRSDYFNAYDRTYGKSKFFKKMEEINKEFTDKQIEPLKNLTNQIIFDTIFSLLSQLFELDYKFKLVYQKNEDTNIDISEITNGELLNIIESTDGFMLDMFGEGGLLELFSKYGDNSGYLE